MEGHFHLVAAPLPFPALANQTYDSSTFRVGRLSAMTGSSTNWLVGVEGDFAWGNMQKRVEVCRGIAIANTGNFSEFKHTVDAGLRARLGIPDHTDMAALCDGRRAMAARRGDRGAANTCGIGLLGGFPPISRRTTPHGWAIGGGVETMLPGKWPLRAEDRYADFGTWGDRLWRYGPLS